MCKKAAAEKAKAAERAAVEKAAAEKKSAPTMLMSPLLLHRWASVTMMADLCMHLLWHLCVHGGGNSFTWGLPAGGALSKARSPGYHPSLQHNIRRQYVSQQCNIQSQRFPLAIRSEGYNKGAATPSGYTHANVYKFLNALRFKAGSFAPRHHFVLVDGSMLCLYRRDAMCNGDSDWDLVFETQRGYDEVFKPRYPVWRRLAGSGDVTVGSNYSPIDHKTPFLNKGLLGIMLFPHDKMCQCNLPGNRRTYCWTQGLDYPPWAYGNSWLPPIPNMKQSIINV